MDPIGSDPPTADDRRLGYKVLAGIVVFLISLAVWSQSTSSRTSSEESGPHSSVASPSHPPAVPLAENTDSPTRTADSLVRIIPISKIGNTPVGELLRAIYVVESAPASSERISWLSVARADANRRASVESTRGRKVNAEGGTGTRRCASPAGIPAAGYRSLIANVWLGKELFLASDCSSVGKIADIQGDYRFPDGTVQDAILISFGDGSADWIPRKTAQLLYVTR